MSAFFIIITISSQQDYKMKKLIAFGILSVLSLSVQAEVLSCSTQTLIVNGNTVASNVPMSVGSTIELTQPKVTLTSHGHALEFWKDGNDYRNDTGRIISDRIHNKYTMETAIPDESTGKYVPAKVIYTCK